MHRDVEGGLGTCEDGVREDDVQICFFLDTNFNMLHLSMQFILHMLLATSQ